MRAATTLFRETLRWGDKSELHKLRNANNYDVSSHAVTHVSYSWNAVRLEKAGRVNMFQPGEWLIFGHFDLILEETEFAGVFIDRIDLADYTTKISNMRVM